MKRNIEKFAAHFLKFYEETSGELDKVNGSIFGQYRKKAFDNFQEGKLELPHHKMENYKYSNLKKIFSHNFVFYSEPQKHKVYPKDIFVCDVPELEADTAILINGWFHDYNGKKLVTTEEGVVFGSLIHAYENGYKDLIDSHINKSVDGDDPLVALNNMFAQDGFFVYIPDNIKVGRPIQLINLVSALEEVALFPHSIIIAGKNSEAKFLLCEHSIFPKHFLNNSVMQIFAYPNSHLEYIRLQNAHNESYQFTSTYVYQYDDSSVRTNTITLHGGVVRNNIVAKLNGRNCYNEMYGLFMVDKGQHVDNWTLIDHLKPDSTSRELFKGIIDDYASGAFAGKILVRKDSQHTHTEQTNKNILLTSDAQMNTKPQLEIYADDVVCSHGATVGQINDDELFYLRQRGISQKSARLMLLNAFAYDVIKDISIEPLRNNVVELVEKRLNGDLSRCNKCEIKC